MTVPLRALIVDDEELARERIRALLADDPEIEIHGECANGREAVEAIRRAVPDLLFLDIQMPEMDGFQVLEAVARERIPAIVFVTAHDRYAVEAFDYAALDYLLKPFDRARFLETLARAKTRIERRDTGEIRRQIDGLLDNLARPHLDRLVVKDAGRIAFVKVGEIRWIEAQGNYASIHAGGETHLLRRTMKDLASRLDPRRFARIHRSIIVNLDRVREIATLLHGEYRVVLDDGTELTSNRRFREVLERLEE